MAAKTKNEQEALGCLILVGIISVIGIFNYMTTHAWTWFAFLGVLLLVGWATKAAYDKKADLRRHGPAIMLLKFFAYSDNKLTKIEFDVIEAYLHTIANYDPKTSPPGTIIKDDFPRLADLERYVLLTRNALDSHEIGVLLDHVEMLRGTRRTHAPIVQEWYQSIPSRLRQPKRERSRIAKAETFVAPIDPTLRPGAGAALLRRRAAQEQAIADAPKNGELARFYRSVSTIQSLTAHDGCRSTAAALRHRVSSIEGVEFDEDIETQLLSLVSADVPDLTDEWAKVRRIASSTTATSIDDDLASGLGRLAVRLDEIVDEQVKRGGDAIATRNAYMRTKHPITSDDPFHPQDHSS